MHGGTLEHASQEPPGPVHADEALRLVARPAVGAAHRDPHDELAPNGPGTSSAVPPWRVTPAAISALISSQIPSLRGAA